MALFFSYHNMRGLGFAIPVVLIFLWYLCDHLVARSLVVLVGVAWVGYYIYEAFKEANMNYLLFPAIAFIVWLFIHPFLEDSNG